MTTPRRNKSKQPPKSHCSPEDNTTQPNYHVDMLDNIDKNSDKNKRLYKVPKKKGDFGKKQEGTEVMGLPLIFSPFTKQSCFYANQINVKLESRLKITTISSSTAPQLKPKTKYAGPATEYFTHRIVKPCYEQIKDCICADNTKQLYNWILDGFSSQVYSWRNAPLVATSSTRMKKFMEQIPQYQVG